MGVVPGVLRFRSRCFPSTDFPRIVVGIDNGVAPINQMQVTVTRPIEEAMNSVPGPGNGAVDHQPRVGGNRICSSTGTWTCSRRSQYVNAALARVQPTLPPTAKLTANRLTFARVSDPGLQPDVGHDVADRAVGAGELHDQAAAESRERRLDGGAARRQRAGVSRSSPIRRSCCRRR